MADIERVNDFLHNKNVGLIMRTFATKSADVPNRVQMVEETLKRAQDMRLGGNPVFSSVDVLVWRDSRFNSDCGETAEAMRAAYPGVNAYEVNGDLFCGLMNTGVANQLRKGIDYTVSISPEAHTYLTAETMADMLEAADKGALAIGIAIDELTPSILRGRLANTFAMWENLSLISVGGFDFRAASAPVDGRQKPYIKGWSDADGGKEVFYARAGVEEMIPLARLFDREGRPIIAPILPSGEGVRHYEIPTDPELLKRHQAKMGTKYERQVYMLMSEGKDPSWLEGAVMPDYRRF